MVKVTKQQAAENRAAVVKAAGRLFRAHGFDGVGVAEITRAAGLTHGGFYGQFASKDALAAEACGQAFAESLALLRPGWTGPVATSLRYVDSYLSERHRDHPRRRLPDGGLRHRGPAPGRGGAGPIRRGCRPFRRRRRGAASCRRGRPERAPPPRDYDGRGAGRRHDAGARHGAFVPELSAEILASVRAQIADLALPEDRAASTG